MKTIVNRIELAKANDVTLIQDTQKNKLIQVTYVKTNVDLKGKVSHVFTNNGKEIIVPEYINRYRMFQDNEHFEKELPVDMFGIFLDDCKIEKRFRFIHDDCRDEARIVSISFFNGIPTDVDAPVKGFELTIHSGYTSIKPIYEDEANLDDFFYNTEDATTFHDYVVVNQEGKEQTVKGRCSYLLPTEDQKPVVEELRAVLEKMKEVGLGIMYSTAYATMHVYNAKNTDIVYDEGGVSIEKISLPDALSLPRVVYDYNDDSYYQIRERHVEPQK